MKKLKPVFVSIILLPCVIAFYLWSKIIWIPLLLLIIIDSFSTKYVSDIIKKLSPESSIVFKYTYLIMLPFFVIIFIRTFLFDYYHVPSSSMERTLFPEDYVVINKIKYGTKVPLHLDNIVAVGKLFKSINTNERYDLYRPLISFASYKRDDIVVFKSVEDHNKFVVKRIIGMPGDTLKIANSGVSVNRYLLVEKENYCYNYIDSIENYKDLKTFSNKEFNLLTKQGKINLVKNINDTELINSIFLFPPNSGWTKDNYGPVIIPRKGMNILLTRRNIDLYKEIIQKYEGQKVIINQGEAVAYTFKNDYYFMLGDNRHNSSDSRYFGFVPDSYIQGKVISVFSKKRIFD